MLTGLGLGPGDPELLTLKAVRLLKEADIVYVPGDLAKKLVEPYCTPVQLPFPMSHDEGVIRKILEKNAEIIGDAASEKEVIFGLIGDPNLFSTYSRLVQIINEKNPDFKSKTIPGISSVTSLMSVTEMPVGSFCVTDGSPVKSVIRMKARHPGEYMEQLKEKGFTRFVLVEKMYMEGMKVFHDDEIPKESSYFSLLYAEHD